MNTFQLSCFLAVAEHLNFAQAARQLHVTHPAVSQQIQSLEKELNVKLFHRTTRSVKLTEEGQLFYHDARQIVALTERAKKRFEDASSENIETLSLGCFNFPCLFLFTDTLKRLRQIRPLLHPRLQVIPFQHIYRLLEEGDLDAVLGFREPFSLKIKTQYREITRVPLVCICPTDHEYTKKESVTTEDLLQQRLALFAPRLGMPPPAETFAALLGKKSPEELYFCETAEAIAILVCAGYAVSILPEILVPRAAQLATVPLADAEPLSFGITYASVQGNPALKAFIHCAKESFAKQ